MGNQGGQKINQKSSQDVIYEYSLEAHSRCRVTSFACNHMRNHAATETNYRDELKNRPMVCWMLSLLLLITSASPCLKHSRNLGNTFFLAQPSMFSDTNSIRGVQIELTQMAHVWCIARLLSIRVANENYEMETFRNSIVEKLQGVRGKCTMHLRSILDYLLRLWWRHRRFLPWVEFKRCFVFQDARIRRRCVT